MKRSPAPAAVFLTLGALFTGCGGRGVGPGAGGLAEARAYYYQDSSGLAVTTTAASLEQKIRPDVAVIGRVVADRIRVRRRVLDPGDPGAASQLTGHHDADAVTSASAIAGGGGVAEKWRFEGLVGVSLDGVPAGVPVTARLLVRAGTEPDYKALSTVLQATADLAERRTTLGAFVGLGHDWVFPIEKPPGHQSEWPAEHGRVLLGASVSQIVTGRLVLQAGTGMTVQRGTLSNPYRRALVLPPGGRSGTLYPEVLPRARRRHTAFVGAAIYLGAGFALHAQPGAYLDSWSVSALTPELSLAKDLLARRGLLVARYRYYRQSAAWFHESHYHTLDEPYLSGDPRLGPLFDHTVGVELRFVLLPATTSRRELTLALGYDLSMLRYREELAEIPVRAHMPMLSVGGAY